MGLGRPAKLVGMSVMLLKLARFGGQLGSLREEMGLARPAKVERMSVMSLKLARF